MWLKKLKTDCLVFGSDMLESWGVVLRLASQKFAIAEISPHFQIAKWKLASFAAEIAGTGWHKRRSAEEFDQFFRFGRFLVTFFWRVSLSLFFWSTFSPDSFGQTPFAAGWAKNCCVFKSQSETSQVLQLSERNRRQYHRNIGRHILSGRCKSSNLFEDLIFWLACSVHFVRRRLWAISAEFQIVCGQNEQSMRVKRSDPQKD